MEQSSWDPDAEQIWTPARVQLDAGTGAGIAPVDAEVSSARWNGWAIPRFSDDNAMVVAQQAVDFGDYRTWGWVDDVLVLVPDPAAFDGPVETFQPDPDGWYYLGSGGWTWEVAGTNPTIGTADGLLLSRDERAELAANDSSSEPLAEPAVPDTNAHEGGPKESGGEPGTNSVVGAAPAQPPSAERPAEVETAPLTAIAASQLPRAARARRYDAITTPGVAARRSLT